MHVEQGDDVKIIHLHFPGLEREDLSFEARMGPFSLEGMDVNIPFQPTSPVSTSKSKLEDDVLRFEVH